jgi:hypothetical protein
VGSSLLDNKPIQLLELTLGLVLEELLLLLLFVLVVVLEDQKVNLFSLVAVVVLWHIKTLFLLLLELVIQ